jgi:hypothetical protein
MNTRYDMPENYYFGGGGDSFITPLSLVGLLLAICLTLWLPRRYVLAPVLAAGLLLPFGITIVVAGLHFQALRLLLAAAWLRFAVRRDLKFPRMNVVDKVFLLWAFSNAITFCILWGTLGAVTNRLGFLWTTLGSYFLVRLLIRDKADVIFCIKVLAVLVVLFAPAMEIEHITRRNLFSILGAAEFSDIREGAIRAKGSFAHAIIAGTTGAMLVPIFVGLWWQGKRNRVIAGLGIVGGIMMAVASASSTPIMTCGAGVLALMLWPMRHRLRIFRWTAVLGIVALSCVMKAPVWFLVARVGGSMGGSGYHRAMLIDNFIRHFGEWWLLGTQNNAAWGFDMWDVDNAYVGAGISGGLITFVLFLALLVYTFKRVGKSRRLVRTSRPDERLVWAIGASLFANAVGFFGIVYFDQSILAWYCVLAIVSATATFMVEGKQPPGELRDHTGKAQKAEEEDVLAIPQYSASMGLTPMWFEPRQI